MHATADTTPVIYINGAGRRVMRGVSWLHFEGGKPMRRSVFATMLTALLFITSCPASSAWACSRAVPFSFNELFAADVIVRATAVRYITEPDPNLRTTGEPESRIEFKIEEILRGKDLPESVVLHGYLSDRDDFNDVGVPYKFVRRDGRAGSCFANTYKQGAQFLLFMKKEGENFTPNISALGPTNEQLRGPEDAWLRWVKEYLKTRWREEDAAPTPFGLTNGMAAWLSFLVAGAS
jgi:hypothetical protein